MYCHDRTAQYSDRQITGPPSDELDRKLRYRRSWGFPNSAKVSLQISRGPRPGVVHDRGVINSNGNWDRGRVDRERDTRAPSRSEKNRTSMAGLRGRGERYRESMTSWRVTSSHSDARHFLCMTLVYILCRHTNNNSWIQFRENCYAGEVLFSDFNCNRYNSNFHQKISRISVYTCEHVRGTIYIYIHIYNQTQWQLQWQLQRLI